CPGWWGPPASSCPIHLYRHTHLSAPGPQHRPQHVPSYAPAYEGATSWSVGKGRAASAYEGCSRRAHPREVGWVPGVSAQDVLSAAQHDLRGEERYRVEGPLVVGVAGPGAGIGHDRHG